MTGRPMRRANDHRMPDTSGDVPPAPRLSNKQRRARLLARLTVALMDEQGGECYWCGCRMWHPRRPSRTTDPDDRATFDHRVTVSRQGPDTKENGVAACRNCNEHRGDTLFEDYEKWPPD